MKWRLQSIKQLARADRTRFSQNLRLRVPTRSQSFSQYFRTTPGMEAKLLNSGLSEVFPTHTSLHYLNSA